MFQCIGAILATNDSHLHCFARDVSCPEFVQMIGSEAHTQSVAAKSGTIKPEHVFAALTSLEMGEFVDKCKV